DVGKYVSQGTPLFRVDDRHLRAQLAMQKANVASARAQYARLEAMPRPEEVPSAEAKLKAAEASLVQAQDEAKRARVLRSQRVVSEEDYVQRQVALQVAQQQRAQAKADLDLLRAGAWRADKDVSRAAVALAEAQAEQTQTEIDRATVRAPISGHIL